MGSFQREMSVTVASTPASPRSAPCMAPPSPPWKVLDQSEVDFIPFRKEYTKLMVHNVAFAHQVNAAALPDIFLLTFFVGMVMSMSSMLLQKGEDLGVEDVEIALQGNLCRCTGYRPIIEGFRTLCKNGDGCIKEPAGANEEMEVASCDLSDCKPYSKGCDPVFPEELKSKDSLYGQPLAFGAKETTLWFKPTSLDQLISIKQKYSNIEFHAGGTGKFKVPHSSSPDAVIQITHLDALQGVRIEADGIFIGAGHTMTKFHEICLNIQKSNTPDKVQVFKTLSTVLKTWVSAQVRNVATIGGHIGWAHPCSDLVPIFMACGCKLEVLTKAGKKVLLPLDKSFFPSAFKTVLRPGDLILNIKVPFTQEGETIFYYRRARRKEFDLPIANAAFKSISSNGMVKEITITAGGMEGAFPGARAAPAKFISSTEEYILDKSHPHY